MFFWITLGALMSGSVMCWMNHMKKSVVVCWIIWILGFFISPYLPGQGWSFLALQSLLALILVLKWKYDDAIP